jgi:hypothetical protein
MFLIRGCTQEESKGKYKGEDQRFCLGEVDQQIQGRLGSHRRSVCCLVLNPLFLVTVGQDNIMIISTLQIEHKLGSKSPWCSICLT